MWSVAVGMMGPQGVPAGHQKGFVTQSSMVAVVVVVREFLGGSSPPQGLGPHQSGDGEAGTVGSNLTKSWDACPRGFFVCLFFPQLLHGWGSSI